jgi:hypothetical protein
MPASLVEETPVSFHLLEMDLCYRSTAVADQVTVIFVHNHQNHHAHAKNKWRVTLHVLRLPVGRFQGSGYRH